MPPAFALSQDQTLRFINACSLQLSPQNPNANEQTQLNCGALGRLRPDQPLTGPNQPKPPKGNLQSVRNASNEYVTNAPSPAKSRSILANPNQNQTNQSPTRSHAQATHRTPPTYPFLAYVNVKEQSQAARSTSHVRNASAALIEGLAP
jgi:hypothetical protein